MNDDQRAEEIRRLQALVSGTTGVLAFPALAEAQRRAGRPEEAERVAREGLEAAPHVSAGRIALALALLDQKRPLEATAELERLLGSEASEAHDEHAIVHEAVASDSPEGLGAAASAATSAAPVAGELATLEPYPGEVPAPESGPDVSFEPEPQGPFGPPPPPAPAEPLVFDATEVRDDELDTAFEEAESDAEQMLGADDVAQAALATVPDEEDGDAELDPVPRVDVAEGEDAFREAVTTEPDSPFATETVASLLEQQGHADEADRIRDQIAATDGSDDALEVDATPEAGAAQAAPEVEAAPAAPEIQDGTGSTPGAGGTKKQATLERWLDNLRRDEG